MRRRWLGLLLLACSAPATGAVGLVGSIAAGAGAHVARDERFPAAAQFRWTVGARVEVTADIGLGGGLSVDFEGAVASSPVDLVVYRGYTGPRIALYAVGWLQTPAPAVSLAVGLRVGLHGAFLRYTNTDTYFVVPGVTMEPVVRLTPPGTPWLALDVSLPVTVTRRADLVLSAETSVSVGVGFQYRTPRKP